jgi:hypothetical protein
MPASEINGRNLIDSSKPCSTWNGQICDVVSVHHEFIMILVAIMLKYAELPAANRINKLATAPGIAYLSLLAQI